MRKIIQHLLLILFLLLLGIMKNFAQQVVSLASIHDEVLANSYNSKSAKYQKDIVDLGYAFYKSQKKPNLSIGVDLPNFSKTSTPITQPDGTIAFQSISQANSSISAFASQVVTATGGTIFVNSDLQRFDDFSSDFKKFNGTPIRIGISQPLFGVNTWKFQDKIQPLKVEEAQKNYNTKIESSLGEATLRYFDILIIKQNLDIALTNQKVNENLLLITEERLMLGKVSKDEKLQLEIELNNAKLEVSQATSQLNQSIARLYTFIGKKTPMTTLDFNVPEIKEIKDINMPALISAYKNNSVEVIAYQREIAEANLDIAQAKSDYGFQANLRASIGLVKGADQLSEVYKSPFQEQQFNLALQVPILDWGKRRSAVQQSRLLKKDTEALYKQQFLELEVNIEQEAMFFSRLQNEIKLLKDIMEKAEERFAISNDRYILGNIDITNLTLAQRDKDQTKRNFINALKSYWSSYYRLRVMTGYDLLNNKEINYN